MKKINVLFATVALLAALLFLPVPGQAQLNRVSVNQIVGTLPATKGGTGTAVYTIGDMLYASSTTALSKLACAAANTVLTGGAPPSCSATPNVTGSYTVTRTALGTVLTDGMLLTNTTAAAAGAQQISPALHLTGQGWSTNSGGASMSTDWRIANLPIQGAAAPTSELDFNVSINGAAYSAVGSLTSAGLFTATNITAGTSVLCTSQCNVGSGGAFRSNSNGTNITMPANGQINLNNNGVSAGVGLDVTTDSTLKVNNRAQNALGTVLAGSYSLAATTAQPADQTGNGTATLKMNGLGAAAAPCTITPTSTGRVVFHVEGDVTNSTILDGIAFKLVYGTGTAPANAAAATGTAITALRGPAVPIAAQKQGFTAEGLATGLTVATAVWYDLQIADVTGGTASASNITCTAHEI